MHRAVCLILLASVFGPAHRLWAATPQEMVHGSGSVPVIHLLFVLHPALQDGTVVICKARLEFQGVPPATANEAAGQATLGGSLSTCALELPLYSMGNHWTGGATLRYAIEIERGPGHVPIPVTGGILPAVPAVPAPSETIVAVGLPSLP